MPRAENQKLKLLYEKEFLERYSDPQHPVTVKDIIDYLAKKDIPAERKAIYSDLRLLEEYGLSIEKNTDRSSKIYLSGGKFEPAELKILIDSVLTSNFITQKKSNELVAKLESMASVYEAKDMHRSVFIRSRIKNDNDSIYYTVDAIWRAIDSKKKIRFRKFAYNLKRKKDLKHNATYYTQSPFALLWVDQNYYMLSYDEKREKLVHFRVDRMTEVTILDEPRCGNEEFEKAEMSTYTRKTFNMFGGELKQVKLRFSNTLIDAVIDRFGTDMILVPDGSDHFTVTTEVAVSQMFYAWLFGFKDSVEIIYPPEVREGMKQQLQLVMAQYDK